MTYPLSQTQMGIFVTVMNAGEEGNYNMDMLYSLDADIDLDRLAAALDAVIEAHPYVKSRLVYDAEGEVVFEDHTDEPFHVTITDVDSIESVRPHLGEDYDMMNDRLFRLEIYRTPHGNYLYVDFHHIIFDGMSYTLFRTDLERAYAGETLEPEAKNGFQVAVEECEARKSSTYDEARNWYLQEFAEAEDVSSMPVPDIQQPSDRETFTTVWKELKFDRKKLDALCEKAGVKESMVFTTAFGYTLSRYVCEDKVQYSTVYHGRNDHQTRHSLCMMVQTLPVFHKFAPSQSVAEALQHCSTQMAGTRHHTCFSFGELHQALGVNSDIVFVYQGTLGTLNVILNGREQKAEDLRVHRTGIKLNIQIITLDGKYYAKTEYPDNRYSSEFMDGFLQSYNNILCEMMIKDTLKDIETCDEEGLRRLDAFNTQEPLVSFDTTTTILDYFRRHVEKTPDREYLVCGDVRLTFAQVDEYSNALAGAILQQLGTSKTDDTPVVSIILNRNEYMAIAPLAAMKAGCAYQPLDPSYPQERLNFMVKDADAKVLIAEEGLEQLVNEYEGPIIKVKPGEGVGKTENNISHFTPHISQPSDLMILLYTSGTTGVPKGVELLHSNLSIYAQYSTRHLGITEDSRITAYASFGFDAYMSDLAMSFVAGCQLHIIPEEMRLDLLRLKDYYDEQGITHSFMTTQVACEFAQTFPKMKTLQVLFTGGEKMASIPVPEYDVLNIYGPTETTVYVTSFYYREYEPNIPIGRPNQGVNAYVVDENFHRLPAGAAGELLVSGAQVGAGYLNRPDKTAEVFVTPPADWHLAPDTVLYRTGDIVRYREDGNIEFVGRKDGLVKIRGFRIELKEVESVILDFPAVKACTVQAFDLDSGGKALAAYIVSDETVDTAALNNFILERKPPYMAPAVIMQIDSIPLNVNQKVDKKKLPKPELSNALSTLDSGLSANSAPMNLLEKKIGAVVGELTGEGEFPVSVPLTSLGITSLMAIKLAIRLNDEFGIEVKTKTIMQGATLQDIENQILEGLLTGQQSTVNGQQSTAESDNSTLNTQNSQLTTSPLSSAQLGVYFECMKDPESVSYNVPTRIQFPKGVTAEEIRDALVTALKAHPSFLSHFEDAEEVTMVCDPEQEVEVIISDNTDEEEMKTFVRPFNLNRGPLFRAVICRSLNTQNSTLNTLLFDAHHLVMDGGSLAILLQDVCRAVNGEAVEDEKYTAFDFAFDERKLDEEDMKNFFAERLRTVDGSSTIPEDITKRRESRDESPENTERTERGVIAAPIDFPAVEQLAKSCGTTPAMVLLSAVHYITARYTNTHDSCICTISNGRSNIRLARTAGMFVNTLPLVSHITDGSVRDFIRANADDFSQVLDNENYPFARLAADFELKPDVVYEYQLGVVDGFSAKGHDLAVSNFGNNEAKFRVAVKVENKSQSQGQSQKPSFVVYYDRNFYTDDYMQRFLDSLVQVLNNMLAAPDSEMKHISIVTPSQEEELSRLRCTATLDIPVKLYHKGMERWAEQTPDKVALIAVDRTLTFREFNEDANRLAHLLLSRGVGKGDAVAILLPRTSWALISMHGIMKTGAAFIPCDPAYPEDRIKLILEDSEAKYVLTTDELAPLYGDKAIALNSTFNTQHSTLSIENPKVEVDPTDLAYMIYTSGSTGRPKGVMLRHEGICSYLTDHPANRHIHAICESVSVYMSVSTISFDLSQKEYGLCLFNGLTCVFAGDNQCNDPVELARLMKETNSDCINGTPSRILQYMELPEFCDCLGRCHVIMSGGEKYSDKLLARLHELSSARIFNTYGPTEITVSCNVAELTKTNDISVGEPLLNYIEYVLDPDGNELPVGVVGELCTGGPGVAVGYNHLPELNKEKFIIFRDTRCFRTGDYARWAIDGKVWVLGRADNQVKLRGLRIELGEVETAISQVEGVKNVVIMIRTIQEREHLCAYFTADRPIDINDMKRQISQTLTSYMVPTAYLQMDAFPLTPNGKTDMRHLPDAELAAVGGEFVEARNDAERFFCDIFADILGLDRVSATDSFFDLGGTSLVVTRVLIEAQKAGFPIVYADVFKYKSARELATFIGAGAEEEDDDADIRNFDYTAINQLISKNSISALTTQNSHLTPHTSTLGTVLLTGATGYLGIHILYELLTAYPESRIICLLRSKGHNSAENRLRNMLYYYFEESFQDLFGKRIFVVEGDVTDPIAPQIQKSSSLPENSQLSALSSQLSAVINCAAIVKHFSKGTEIEDVNVGGCSNCVDYCLQTGARMIQVSTMSVGGSSVNGVPDRQYLTEDMLYEGQRIRSQYIHSKIMGERCVLDAVANKGLDGKVMRVGTLSARSTDGEYQINYQTNSFVGRLRIYNMLGAFPYDNYENSVEFSPINEVARAICLLAQTPREFTVFHPFNNHSRMLGDVVQDFNRGDSHTLRFVEQEEFNHLLEEAEKDEEKQKVLSSLLAYRNNTQGEVVRTIGKSNHFTTQVLLRMGFRWSMTSDDYVRQFFDVMRRFKYWD